VSIYGFKRSSYRERFPGICLTGFLIAGPMSLRPCISGPRGLASEKLTSNSKRRSCGGSKPMAIISGSHGSIGGPCLTQWCDPDLDAGPWRVRRNDPVCREFGRCHTNHAHGDLSWLRAQSWHCIGSLGGIGRCFNFLAYVYQEVGEARVGLNFHFIRLGSFTCIMMPVKTRYYAHRF